VLVDEFDSNELHIRIFSLTGTRHDNQDRWTVLTTNKEIRAAVADGCTPWRSVEAPGGDPAAWAASTAIRHLSSPSSMPRALAKANKELWTPGLEYSRQQAMTQVVAADLRYEDGAISFTACAAGDSEIWVAGNSNGTIHLAAGGLEGALAPHALKKWKNMEESQSGNSSFDEKLLYEAATFEHKENWNSPGVGRYPDTKYSHTPFTGTTSTLILASDGADLTEAAAQQVPVKQIPEWLNKVAEKTDRDDLTCVIIETAHNR